MTAAHNLAPSVAGAFLTAVAQLAEPGHEGEAQSRAAAALRAAAAGTGLLALHPTARGLLAAAEAVARGDLVPGVEAARGVLATLEGFAIAFGVVLADLPEYRHLPRELRQPAFSVAFHDRPEFAMPRQGAV